MYDKCTVNNKKKEKMNAQKDKLFCNVNVILKNINEGLDYIHTIIHYGISTVQVFFIPTKKVCRWF